LDVGGIIGLIRCR